LVQSMKPLTKYIAPLCSVPSYMTLPQFSLVGFVAPRRWHSIREVS
jgi:hypothetical protein